MKVFRSDDHSGSASTATPSSSHTDTALILRNLARGSGSFEDEEKDHSKPGSAKRRGLGSRLKLLNCAASSKDRRRELDEEMFTGGRHEQQWNSDPWWAEEPDPPPLPPPVLHSSSPRRFGWPPRPTSSDGIDHEDRPVVITVKQGDTFQVDSVGGSSKNDSAIYSLSLPASRGQVRRGRAVKETAANSQIADRRNHRSNSGFVEQSDEFFGHDQYARDNQDIKAILEKTTFQELIHSRPQPMAEEEVEDSTRLSPSRAARWRAGIQNARLMDDAYRSNDWWYRRSFQKASSAVTACGANHAVPSVSSPLKTFDQECLEPSLEDERDEETTWTDVYGDEGTAFTDAFTKMTGYTDYTGYSTEGTENSWSSESEEEAASYIAGPRQRGYRSGQTYRSVARSRATRSVLPQRPLWQDVADDLGVVAKTLWSQVGHGPSLSCGAMDCVADSSTAGAYRDSDIVGTA